MAGRTRSAVTGCLPAPDRWQTGPLLTFRAPRSGRAGQDEGWVRSAVGTGPTARSSGHSGQDEWAGAVAGVMSVGGGDVGEAVELVRAGGGRD